MYYTLGDSHTIINVADIVCLVEESTVGGYETGAFLLHTTASIITNVTYLLLSELWIESYEMMVIFVCQAQTWTLIFTNAQFVVDHRRTLVLGRIYFTAFYRLSVTYCCDSFLRHLLRCCCRDNRDRINATCSPLTFVWLCTMSARAQTVFLFFSFKVIYDLKMLIYSFFFHKIFY